ncbi:MAG: PEGA domain-containing protein [Marinobacter sp.]|uniref:PEGA domain-containing protein n=1 Tax=Marinobacter sp. TaxID=50741 RepID=UPI00299E7F7B|nr:PEGA domain-containing protein [Marinobacter sp.]MDX1757150.1 PEGA domain-containing protein [Marinobacter sp.]
MVDFRPLLFINALAIMLLVTAGFASVRDSLKLTPTLAQPSPLTAAPTEPPAVETASYRTGSDTEKRHNPPADNGSHPTAPTEVAGNPAPAPSHPTTTTPESAAEPPGGPIAQPFTVAVDEPEPEPAPAPPTTGQLTLRSNVHDDVVTINGEHYGPTRLDLSLKPGRYEVEISKPGFRNWSRSITLEAGDSLTLMGQLEKYTRVEYRDGTWIGGVKTGDGRYIDDTGLRYEGHFVDGKFDGQGTAWYPDGGRYEGDWQAGARHGEGRYRAADDSLYTGQFADNGFSGQGTLTLANGDILSGQWQDSKLNGHGSLTTADGMLYVGGFRDGEFHGEGTLTYPDGRHYQGEFSNGRFHGSGSEVFASGKKYQGQYMDGKFHGNGLLLNPNGSSIEATFRHGEPYGQVRLTTAAGEVFTARTSEPGVCYREKSYRATQCPVLEGW